ncbi:Isovaleryl-CoA dehydrogenase [Mycolicibacterium rhodesiae JS60]|nr:Isovaleryl-CoA dehydrogenase [Mycolicibacterium rhodesiae JS60]
MRFGLTAEQFALRGELRVYMNSLLDDDLRHQLHDDPSGTAMRKVVKRLANDRWLGIGWPTEYGGQGRSAAEQLIFFDEAVRAGVPFPVIAVNLIGPTLMLLGTEEQKRQFLPAILDGDALFCIGYSEPSAGTDLAAIRTSAVPAGEDLIINGEKTWTSFHTTADYCWLAVRTNPEEPRNAGLSVVIVPMDAAGIMVHPLRLLNDHDIASVHFDNVRVPATNLVGGLHGGWKVITSQLNFERRTMGAPGACVAAFDVVRAWAAEPTASGERIIDRPWVQAALAKAYAELSVAALMTWDNALSEVTDIAKVSATKVNSTESFITVLELLLEVLGEQGYLQEGSPGAVARSMVEAQYRHHLALTFGGGANEIQRELVAMTGLGLPRSR